MIPSITENTIAQRRNKSRGSVNNSISIGSCICGMSGIREKLTRPQKIIQTSPIHHPMREK